MVTRISANMCAELVINPTNFDWYHKNHINKCMAVAVTNFAFNYSIDNGGDAIKIGFVRAQQYNIANRLVTRNTETNADVSRKVVREKDDPWLVNCSVTGSRLGTPDNPKFLLKGYFRKTILPIVGELVSPGEKYAGYNTIFQGKNSGPHEEDQNFFLERLYYTLHIFSPGDTNSPTIGKIVFRK